MNGCSQISDFDSTLDLTIQTLYRLCLNEFRERLPTDTLKYT
jgi:hypothetical protein